MEGIQYIKTNIGKIDGQELLPWLVTFGLVLSYSLFKYLRPKLLLVASGMPETKKSFYETADTKHVKPVDEDFKWDEVDPIKSLPFKNATYKLTMGIKNLDIQDWLLVEPTYKHRIENKKLIIRSQHPAYPASKDTRRSTFFIKDEAIPAIKEFYNTVVTYMREKYPMYFKLDGDMIHNLITDEKIPAVACDDDKAVEYLESLALTIEEDFLILLKDPSREHEKDGTEYFFKAGVFGFAAGFDPRDRFDMPLSFIHHPIPGYEEKLKLSMNRFFNRISPGQFVTRSNFSVQTHNKLYVDDSNKGHNLPKDAIQVPLDVNSLDFVNDVHYRSERQVLTKLPESGAVVFTIRTYLIPMHEIKSEGKEVCERFIGAINGLPEDISYYKRAGEWGPPLIEYLSS